MRILLVAALLLIVPVAFGQSSPIATVALRIDTSVRTEDGRHEVHQVLNDQLSTFLQLHLITKGTAVTPPEQSHWEIRVRARPQTVGASDLLVVSTVFAQPVPLPEMEKTTGNDTASGAWVPNYLLQERWKTYRVIHNHEAFVVPREDLEAAAIKIADSFDDRVLRSLRALIESGH